MPHNNTQLPAFGVTPQLTPAASPASSHSDFTHLSTEALIDVLVEQVSYLVNHGNICGPDCRDCDRLGRVKQYLLQPFLETAKTGGSAGNAQE